ncbi:hypothetical protein LXL04_015418 [Taraxacum kok-saghyz]
MEIGTRVRQLTKNKFFLSHKRVFMDLFKKPFSIFARGPQGIDLLTFLFSLFFKFFKSTNILLSDDYEAKISDFGLAKPMPEGQETNVTQGYFGPFFLSCCCLSRLVAFLGCICTRWWWWLLFFLIGCCLLRSKDVGASSLLWGSILPCCCSVLGLLF